MNFLYIGQYTPGTTSKMRAEVLRRLLPSYTFEVIDSNVPFMAANKWFRSLGFRHKIGPMITAINTYIKERLVGNYDLVWIDKGIFLREDTLRKLRSSCSKLVHYTPDAAFLRNKSKLFEQSIPYYDHLVTTKSFELEHYHKFSCRDLILTTQGYNPEVHKPSNDFEEKSRDVVFIGLCEPHREKLVSQLLEAGIRMSVGGKKWNRFYRENKSKDNLEFLGDQIYGDDYARLISSSRMALGLLSKIFPERHTTRTFEIPACGTVLITERNEETSRFYNEDEAVFYDNETELSGQIMNLLEDRSRLKSISERGYKRVTSGDFSYEKILYALVERCT